MNVLFLDDVADADLPRLLASTPEPEARALVRDELNARSPSPQHFATVRPTENPENPMPAAKIEAVPAVETPLVPAAPPETLVEYLARVRAKDVEKHGALAAGWRTTREVADFFSLTPHVARRRLEPLVEEGVAECANAGSSLVWRSTTLAEAEIPTDVVSLGEPSGEGNLIGEGEAEDHGRPPLGVSEDGPFAGIPDPNVHMWGERLGPLVNEYDAWCVANRFPHVSADEQDLSAATPEQRAWIADFTARWDAAQAADDAASAPAGISTLVEEDSPEALAEDWPPIPASALRVVLRGLPVADDGARSFAVVDPAHRDAEIAKIVESRLGEVWTAYPYPQDDEDADNFPSWNFRDFWAAHHYCEAWANVVDGEVKTPLDPAVAAQDAEFEAAAIAARADIRVEIPTRPEDEDLSECERMGFRNFAEGEGIDQNPHGPEEGGWVRGWWLAHARCYGQGVKAAVAHEATFHPAGPELVNPYPAFSPAGEAWASGADEAEAL